VAGELEGVAMKLLHIGCGNVRPEGFINTDKDEMDITKPWPYKDGSVDGITSMAVIQCLTWKELMFAFKESLRVLKKGGVMRIGVTLAETNYPLEKILYGKNINLFSYELLKNVLIDRIGYSSIKLCKWRETSVPEFAPLDIRHHRGSSYIEVIK
jgi:hypothetical protein